MNITVVGIGYVGLSNAVLLSRYNNVILLDIDENKVNDINMKKSPIEDNLISKYMHEFDLKLEATLDKEYAFKNSDYIIIATPTNYNEDTNFFDTSSIETVIHDILIYNNKAIIIIKSTIPIGYTEKLKNKFSTHNIIFSPEFLREGKALYDNLYPSRIIIGEKSDRARYIANMFVKASLKIDVPVFFMNSSEAECVKLFSNAYLAMRIGFFNELDTYAIFNNLNTRDIIDGVSADLRIGNYYNNPSFGYGGYCLPKDTKQLLANFRGISNSLIGAIVKTNEIRKNNIVKFILSKSTKNIGIYRLLMKKNADNFRNSIMLDLIDMIKKDIEVIIYEPLITDNMFKDCVVDNDINSFLQKSELIVANRIDYNIYKYKDKIFTTDIFESDD
ncbi:nucleotide sugar dehydrogenase [Campylobacter volucris]|uniref:UDP-glucose 6-dehydrogenase n=1 Tax=Campylobacter volucris TaxID=1031542 RepID=A0A5C7DYF1_9BACT|nr:nucleotide sugar dehydrogenase [Campylobacter volucris]TXE89691.1 nucleotide sugar dehydrogenase [Campylobacter volucris]